MLGFYPIADAPLASLGTVDASVTLASQTISLTLNSVSLSTGQVVPLTSQTLNFTQNSVLISDDDVIEVAGQVLTLTLNGVSLSTSVDTTLASQSLTLTENSIQVEVQPPTFDSQTISLTLNGVTLVTNVDAILASQNLTLEEKSVILSTTNIIPLTAETPLGLTLNSVALSVGQQIVLTSLPLALTENPVSLVTDQTIVAGSQTIYTTLNDLRLWKIIPTVQPGTCPDHCDGIWTDIPFDTLVYGDDQAIATMPLCSIPRSLPPIRKFPGTPWTGVTTQTTTTWSNIQT